MYENATHTKNNIHTQTQRTQLAHKEKSIHTQTQITCMDTKCFNQHAIEQVAIYI